MIPQGSSVDLTMSQLAPRIVFVVTVRDNASLLDLCLESVAHQTYPSIRCVVIDDASQDETAGVARRWASDFPHGIQVVVNAERRGKMANLVDALSEVDDHDVVVELDGDDRLLSADAATDLARIHIRVDLVWTQHQVARGPWRSWTHWRSTDLPLAYRLCRELPRLTWSRSWYPGHLRSFKAWMFRRIEYDDLKLDGQFVAAAADAAYFCPLLEMTPPELRYFYDRELCVYNITSGNDHFGPENGVSDRQTQPFVATHLFSRPPYRQRPSPLWAGVIEQRSASEVIAVCAKQIATEPAARLILVSANPVVKSWHPRVQVLRLPLSLSSEVCEHDRVDIALRWVVEAASPFSTSRVRRAIQSGLPLLDIS